MAVGNSGPCIVPVKARSGQWLAAGTASRQPHLCIPLFANFRDCTQCAAMCRQSADWRRDRLAIASPRKLARAQNSRGPDLCHQSEHSGQMKHSLLDVRSRDPSSVAVHLWACTADMLQHVVLSLAGLTSCCRMKKITGLQDALKTRNSAWG